MKATSDLNRLLTRSCFYICLFPPLFLYFYMYIGGLQVLCDDDDDNLIYQTLKHCHALYTGFNDSIHIDKAISDHYAFTCNLLWPFFSVCSTKTATFLHPIRNLLSPSSSTTSTFYKEIKIFGNLITLCRLWVVFGRYYASEIVEVDPSSSSCIFFTSRS